MVFIYNNILWSRHLDVWPWRGEKGYQSIFVSFGGTNAKNTFSTGFGNNEPSFKGKEVPVFEDKPGIKKIRSVFMDYKYYLTNFIYAEINTSLLKIIEDTPQIQEN